MKYPVVLLSLMLIWSCGDGDNKEDNDVPSGPTCGPYPDQANSLYVLPYEIGTELVLGQGNCSLPNRSHAMGTVEQYSYDFLMAIGTPITASRAGTVTRIEEGFAENNGTPGQENRIEILHNDGTVGVYLHLTTDGADVSLSQRVQQGDVIGRSGNTGNSTEPHLHFCVWGISSSIPVVFSNTRAHPDGLREGERYEALPF